MVQQVTGRKKRKGHKMPKEKQRAVRERKRATANEAKARMHQKKRVVALSDEDEE